MAGSSSTGDPGYHEELRVVRVPNDAIRSRSSNGPRYERDLMRDPNTKGIFGPTESRAPTPEERRSLGRPAPQPSLGDQALAAGINAGVNAAVNTLVTELTPYVERGVNNLIRAMQRKIAERRTRAASTALEPTDVVDAEILNDEPRRDVEESTPAPTMGGDEFRERLLAAILAERFAGEQRRRLAGVNLVDDALSPELKAALRTALDAPASSLDDDTLALLVEFLGGSEAGGSRYLLLPPDEAEEVERELGSDPTDPPASV